MNYQPHLVILRISEPKKQYLYTNKKCHPAPSSVMNLARPKSETLMSVLLTSKPKHLSRKNPKNPFGSEMNPMNPSGIFFWGDGREMWCSSVIFVEFCGWCLNSTCIKHLFMESEQHSSRRFCKFPSAFLFQEVFNSFNQIFPNPQFPLKICIINDDSALLTRRMFSWRVIRDLLPETTDSCWVTHWPTFILYA